MTKTFLISGAAGGLGGRLVEAALQAGHNVLATDLAADAVPVPDEHRDPPLHKRLHQKEATE